MEYLDEVYPQVSLLPKGDPIKRAEVRRLCNVVVSDIQPVQVYDYDYIFTFYYV